MKKFLLLFLALCTLPVVSSQNPQEDDGLPKRRKKEVASEPQSVLKEGGTLLIKVGMRFNRDNFTLSVPVLYTSNPRELFRRFYLSLGTVVQNWIDKTGGMDVGVTFKGVPVDQRAVRDLLLQILQGGQVNPLVLG